ncbi:LOW QUALITY PROTEIN: hypothetical protein Cgig2_015421 [Carnegiea gigantea]|uniref:Uncharacterized protein n=1 Tax=Carnegiea gigantea TaxID=171969 RepID=A0A9Q1GFE7_9CARY|nr:LOW QUALITY PROTEIN: hypothetical protein Cgig2_015421 [Carnegiea gigantea]
MGQRPRPRLVVSQSSASSEPAGSQWASSRRIQGRAPARKRISPFIPRETKGGTTGRTLYLLGLLSDEVLPLLLPPAFSVGHHLFGSGVPGLEDHQPRPRLICIKQTGSQVSTKHKAITGLGPPLLGPPYGLNCLSHEPKDGPRFIILAYIELEVTGGPLLVSRGFPETEEEVVLPVLHLRFLLDSHHEARPIVKVISSQVLSLLGSPLNCMNEAERSSRTRKAAQLTGCYKGTNVVPRSGHDLRWHQLVLIQHLPDHGMKGEAESGRPINHYTLGKRLIHGVIHLRNYERVLGGQEESDCLDHFAGPSRGAPGNSDPSTMISVIEGVQPFCLTTDLPGPNNASGEDELVEALSEDELRGECQRRSWTSPPQRKC